MSENNVNDTGMLALADALGEMKRCLTAVENNLRVSAAQIEAMTARMRQEIERARSAMRKTEIMAKDESSVIERIEE